MLKLAVIPLAVIAAVMIASLALASSAAHADEFDSRINLELAFRDTIRNLPAPKHYLPLIRDGETTITFVSDLPATVGKTDFLLNLSWLYDYRYKTRVNGGVTEVTVTATNLRLTPRLRHVIRLPVAFYRDDVWDSQLLGHEFDHVAVSIDPRPRALLVHLCSHLPAARVSVEGAEPPSDEQIRAKINHEIRGRQSAIIDLVRTNYGALDKVTTHGRTAMQDRNHFFESLYTRSNLEAASFPYLNEVAAILDSEAYRRLRPRHVPADPTMLPRR